MASLEPEGGVRWAHDCDNALPPPDARPARLWLSFVEPLVEAVEAAERRVADLQAAAAIPGLSGLTVQAYRSLARPERAAVLRAMIDCVFCRNVGHRRGPQAIPIDERRVRILWRGQGPTDLPAHSKVSPLVRWAGFEDEAPPGVAMP